MIKKVDENNLSLKKPMEFVLGVTKTGLDIIDSRFNMVYIDPQWQKVYGDPTGKKCYQYFMDRDKICPDCGLVKAFRTHKPVSSEELLPKEGNRVVQVTSIPFKDEKGDWLVAEVNVDLSERKALEKDIVFKNALLEAQLNTSLDGILVVDDQGRVILHNERFGRMWGIPRGVLDSKNDKKFISHVLLQLKFPSVFVNKIKYLYKAKYEQSHDLLEFKDGRFFERYSSPLKDREGRYYGRVWYFYDITELKNNEKEIHESYAQLKKLHNELAISEKFRAIGHLACGVAHEVKNPLGVLLLGINFLEKKIKGSQEEVFETLSMMKGCIERADKIVNDLLDYSKLKEGKFSPADLNPILEKDIKLARVYVLPKNIRISSNLSGNLPKVMIDKDKVEQLVINLLMNAIESIEKKGEIGINSYVKCLNKPQDGVNNLGKRVFRKGEKVVVLEVCDTGSGIPKRDLKRLFEPFFTTKTSRGGIGLGLEICLSIVNEHAGIIRVNSKVGRGTTFSIFLKAQKEG